MSDLLSISFEGGDEVFSEGAGDGEDAGEVGSLGERLRDPRGLDALLVKVASLASKELDSLLSSEELALDQREILRTGINSLDDSIQLRLHLFEQRLDAISALVIGLEIDVELIKLLFESGRILLHLPNSK